MEEKWMRLALEEAAKAADAGEVPVGCVIVKDDDVVARGHNCRETKKDPTGHAELVAIQAAAAAQDAWRLLETTLYVTLEPCIQCVGAMILARIPKVVFGCTDPKGGALGTVLDLSAVDGVNHRLDVKGGVLATECAKTLQGFFKNLREEKPAEKND